MELGVSMWDFAVTGGPTAIRRQVADAARVMDEAGVGLICMTDHFIQMPPERTGQPHIEATSAVLEGYNTLSFMAALTERANLGLMVTSVTYRSPGVLAHTIATLDALSGGRAWLGIGVGWYEREHLGLSIPFPSLKDRYEQLAETLEICRQMWGEDTGPYEGKHYQLAETICQPAPLRPVPVLVAGRGPRKTMPIVARYADLGNVYVRTPEEVTETLDLIRKNCDEIGRDPAEIKLTVSVRPDPANPTEFLREMEKYAKAGAYMVVTSCTGPDLVASAKVVAAVAKPLSELG